MRAGLGSSGEAEVALQIRVYNHFYTPKNVRVPAPALVVMHEWGGPMLFGSERVCGETDHPVLVKHRAETTSGRALADFYASHGYCVLVIDAYHFGRRAPRGIGGLPEVFDPFTLDQATLASYEAKVRDQLYLGVRQLNWAGTTWCGVNFGDDSRCVDYLLSRPEVDGGRIGVTGLSGGGWRTDILAALDDRIRAAIPVGWMTTGDHQQPYNVAGAIGTFCLLPGVWDRIDIPDLIAMAAPKACMVVSGRQDMLFPPAGQREAARQIAAAYEWASCPNRFRDYAPDKPHCYDREIQEQALAWFDLYLKNGLGPQTKQYPNPESVGGSPGSQRDKHVLHIKGLIFPTWHAGGVLVAGRGCPFFIIHSTFRIPLPTLALVCPHPQLATSSFP